MKLTKERIDILAKALRKGTIIKHACIGAGICEKTYHNWQNEASDKELDPLDPEEALGKNPNRDDVLRYFVRETSKALNDYSSELLEKIHNADSWQAASWILERRFPEEFGRRAAAQRVDTKEDAQTETETTEQTQSETGKPEDNPNHPNYTGRPPNGTFEKLARRWDEKHAAQEAQGKNGDTIPDI